MIKYMILCGLIFLQGAKCQTTFSEFNPDLLLSKIQSFTVDALKYKKIQDHFDNLRYSQTHLNGEHLLNSLVKAFGSKFGDRVVAVRRLRDAVLESYTETNVAPQTCCSFDPQQEGSYDPQFNTKTATSQYCEKVSPTSPNKTVHLNSKFLKTCKENLQHLPSIKWQYFGSEQGVTSLFPASPTNDCNSYDNRVRPWYVETNVPAPKHLVLVVDISKSMRTSISNGVVLMKLAQQAVKTVINTLNAKDSFAVLGFSDITHTVPSEDYGPCFADILAKATTRNKKKVSTFVESLSAGGATSYKSALEKAFTYFDNEQMNSFTEVDRVILFISDGEPQEREEEILGIIENRNSKLNNSVVLMTYGLGNASFDILKKMSSLSVQSSKFEESQAFTQIKNPSNLRNQMATYYNFFATAGHATNDPIWTVPYLDAWGLGLIITGSLPVYSGGKLIGVVAVDVTVEELLTESIHFRPNQLSYSFVINDAGLVISHPLLPNYIEDSLFISATALERDQEFLPVFESLRSGGSGNKTFLSTRFLPLGNNKYGVKELSVLSTYYWSQVPNSKFSICLVLQSNTLTTLSEQGFLLRESLLNRDWLVSPPQSTCLHLNTVSTTETTTVFLGNEAYRNVTLADTNAVYNRNPDKYAANIKDEIKNLVVATEAAENYWKNMDSALKGEIVWVYIATNEGLVRVFPGTQLPKNFDPKLRRWFQHITAYGDKHVVTTPYKDAVTGLPVITLGRTLYKGRKENNTVTRREACGVMAVDILLSYFKRLLTKVYPSCENTNLYGCFVIDKGGYLVASNKNESIVLPNKHITEVQPSIASALIRDGVLKTTSCSELETGYRLRSYHIPDSQKRHTAITGNLPCKKFQIIPVNTTNVYIVILKEQNVNCPSLTNRPCTCRNWIVSAVPSCSSSWTGDFCECPCTAYNPFYQSCLNKYLPNSPPPCSPPLTRNELNFTLWRETKESALHQPRCFKHIFDFKYEIANVSNANKTPNILAGVFVTLFVIVVGVGLFFFWRRRQLRSKNTEPKVPLGSEVGYAAPPSGPSNLYPVLPPYTSSPSTMERTLPVPRQPSVSNIENLFVIRRTLPERSPNLSSRPPPINPSFESSQMNPEEAVIITPSAPEIITGNDI